MSAQSAGGPSRSGVRSASLVVGAVVAEQLAAAVAGFAALRGEDRLVVVADLVAQRAERRAIGLAERDPPLLALGRVGLGEVERDHAVGVAGRHRPAVAGQEVEGQPARLLAEADDRQPQLEQREQQPPLRRLGLDEAAERRAIGVRRPRAREQAGAAQGPRLVRRVVAGRDLVVDAAEMIGLVDVDEAAVLPVEAQRGVAVQTARRLERDEAAADGAGEGEHDGEA